MYLTVEYNVMYQIFKSHFLTHIRKTFLATEFTEFTEKFIIFCSVGSIANTRKPKYVNKIGFFASLSLCIFALNAINAFAQGIIFPRPCPRPIIHCPMPPQIPQEPLKVKSIHISTKINEQVATTHIEQIFRNDSPYTVEGLYFFPLADDVSITEFAMWDGNKRLTGEVRRKEDARHIYNDIVRSRKDPALLEYVGRNLFQASIFPIPPHSNKKIELTYTQVLKIEGGAVSFKYPLGTGWRAHQLALRGGRMEPENQIPGTNETSSGASVSAEVEISSRVPLKSVYSPSHEIEVKRDGEHNAKASFEVKATANQPDFRLLYTLSDKDIGISLLTHKEPSKDGYFMLIASPKAELKTRDVTSKDIVFVIDTSGSMEAGGKIDKAKSALRMGIETLNPEDRFNVISFAGEDHLINDGLINANDSGKKQAKDFVDKMRAVGGTNINDALLTAFKQIQKNDKPCMIIFITDGLPTVGVTDINSIMANAKTANSSKVRLFTLGVGYDVNTTLLDALAADHKGTPAYIEPNEDLEIKMSDFFSKVNNPVLSDIEINWGGLDTALVYPRNLPDLFSNSQLIVIGRYKSSTEKITVSGKINGKAQNFIYDNLKFRDKESSNDFLPHLWASRRVGYLLEQIRKNGESKELRDEIVELGTKYGIVTPYTSHLVLEPEMNRQRLSGNLPMPRGGERRRDMDKQKSMGIAAGVAPPPPVAESVLVTTGKDAVQLSKATQDLQQSGRVYQSKDESSSDSRIRRAQNQTFYLQNDIWVDGQFKEGNKAKVIKLKFGSDEYFDLIAKEPELAEVFSLGKQVLVVWKGQIYQSVE